MTTRANVSFTDEMYRALFSLSRERGVPIAYIVRESVAAYLERSSISVSDVHPEWGGRRSEDGRDDHVAALTP
jgi:hypothetical protein